METEICFDPFIIGSVWLFVFQHDPVCWQIISDVLFSSYLTDEVDVILNSSYSTRHKTMNGVKNLLVVVY